MLTQACDLANAKTTKVQVALMHDAQMLVDEGYLKSQTIRDQIRRHRVFGWYFLPADNGLRESIVDLRDIHTIPRDLLEERIRQDFRQATVISPYREHLAQHFAVTYSRIALPSSIPTSFRKFSKGNTPRLFNGRQSTSSTSTGNWPSPRSRGTRCSMG